jgi:hypothetical protein
MPGLCMAGTAHDDWFPIAIDPAQSHWAASIFTMIQYFFATKDHLKQLVLALLCAALSSEGCVEQGTEDIEITYLQGGCRGICPTFSIQIQKDRSLQYVGFSNVLVEDTVFGRVTSQQFNELLDAFQQCHYFSFKDQYEEVDVTDMASATTSLKLGTRYKSVRHYFGDRLAPAELKQLYFRINKILDTKQWVGQEVQLIFSEDFITSGR